MANDFSFGMPLSQLHPTPSTWRCPVCSAAIAHEFRPGRKRVYCSDACKQRAYRWRCRHGVRVLSTPWRPARRSASGRMHAVRPPADFVARPTDEQRRHVAVCGAFAHVAPERASGHTEFVPGSPTACRSCTQLIGADPAWHTEFPVIVAAPPPQYVRYRPPAERWAAYVSGQSP